MPNWSEVFTKQSMHSSEKKFDHDRKFTRSIAVKIKIQSYFSPTSYV